MSAGSLTPPVGVDLGDVDSLFVRGFFRISKKGRKFPQNHFCLFEGMKYTKFPRKEGRRWSVRLSYVYCSQQIVLQEPGICTWRSEMLEARIARKKENRHLALLRISDVLALLSTNHIASFKSTLNERYDFYRLRSMKA